MAHGFYQLKIKRERIDMNRNEQRFELAKAAMNGMLAGHTNASDEQIAVHSCNIADALLAELDRTAPKEPTGKESLKVPDPDGWIPHVPGDAMPCDGSTAVLVKHLGRLEHDKPFRASLWRDGAWDNWTGIKCPKDDQIIAWKPA